MDRLRMLLRMKDLEATKEFLLQHQSIQGRDLDGINDLDPDHVVSAALLAGWTDEESLGVVKQLVAVGARCDLRVDVVEHTCLHVAASRGFTQVCAFMLEHGADPLYRVNEGLPAYVLACFHPTCLQLLLDNTLRHGLSARVTRHHVLQLALIVACGEGCPATVKLLLDQYKAQATVPAGDVLCQAVLGTLLPLQVVTAVKNEDAAYRVTRELLAHGADPTDGGGAPTTPMAEAIDAGATGVVRAMLDAGVSFKTGDDGAIPGLTRAASRNAVEIVRLLLAHGANVDGGGQRSFGTPLFQAITSGPKCVEPLLAAGADLNARNPTGLSCLHAAVEVCDLDLLELLLESGADPNCKDEEGRTPLDLAARRVALPCVMSLLDYGADPSQCNRSAVDTLDVWSWLSPEEREVMGSEDRLRDCYTMISRVLTEGFVWPEWNKQNHALFPRNVKRAIFATLCCWKLRRDSTLAMLPRDVLPMVFGFIATRSRHNSWKFAKRQDWSYSQAFVHAVVRRNVDSMLSPQIRDCIQRGDCTKHGTEYEPQPFFSCEDCGMCPRGQANMGCCWSCMERCHLAKGHKVFLNSVQPAFCDCNGSAHCKITDRLTILASPEVQGFVNNEEAAEGFLVCIQTFPDVYEGQKMLAATPGELVLVRREDVNNGVANCSVRGVKGSFPFNSQYVRWIQEFVVMGEDHTGTGDLELSYKRGDFVLVLEPLEGRDAEGKDDPWAGMLCRPEGTREGWFEGFRCDWATQFDPEVVQMKCEAAKNYLKLQELRTPTDETDFTDGVVAGVKASELWEAVGERKTARPSFSTVGTHFMTARDLATVYGSLGEYQLAYDWARKSLAAQQHLQPPRPAMDVLGLLLNVIEYGARARRPEEELEQALRQFVERMPEGNNAMPFMHIVALIAVRGCAGRLNEVQSACAEFFEMARRLELPRGHPIWREASYWLTLAGMYLTVAVDARHSLATKHLTNMLISDRMGPSNACFLEAFQLNADTLLASRTSDSPEALQHFSSNVGSLCSLLTNCLFCKPHLPMLSWRGLQMAVQKLYARLVAGLVCAGSVSSVPGTIATEAASLLALHPHDFASRPILSFSPKTEHSRYILETFVLQDTVHHGLLREIVVSAEDAGTAVVVPAEELQLSDTRPNLVVLRDPDTLEVLDCQLWASRALLALCKPSPGAIATHRSDFAKTVASLKSANSRGPPSQRISSKPLLKPATVSQPTQVWKYGAAAAAAVAVAAGAVWYLWNRGNAKEN